MCEKFVTETSRRYCIVFGFAVVLAVGASRNVHAQFLCSVPASAGSTAGLKDGVNCTMDENCFVACPNQFGACVEIQGVCNGGGNFDGAGCDCPGGTCIGATCSGGVFAGDPCSVTGGMGSCDPGIPCLNNAQCAPSTCVSTGKFCDSGDFADLACVDSADCAAASATGTSGTCITASPDCSTVTPTPSSHTTSPTATRSAPTTPPSQIPTTRTPTKTPSLGTPPPTVTGTPPAPAPPTVTPLPGMTRSPTASPTLALNTAVVAQDAPPGATRLIVTDGENLPTSGTIASVNGEPIVCGTDFNRSAGSNTLVLALPGLPRDVPAGAVISVGRVQCTQEFVDQGSSCTIAVSGDRRGLLLLAGGMLLGLLFRRRNAK